MVGLLSSPVGPENTFTEDTMSFKFKSLIINAPDTNPSLSRKKKGESKMSKFGKYFLFAAGFALLVPFARVPGAIIKVHAQENPGCSVASLKGTYAFRRTGVNNVVGGPIAQIGINVEDGEGNIKLIRTTRSSNGVILD
jgi:hypothetical protein